MVLCGEGEAEYEMQRLPCDCRSVGLRRPGHFIDAFGQRASPGSGNTVAAQLEAEAVPGFFRRFQRGFLRAGHTAASTPDGVELTQNVDDADVVRCTVGTVVLGHAVNPQIHGGRKKREKLYIRKTRLTSVKKITIHAE